MQPFERLRSFASSRMSSTLDLEKTMISEQQHTRPDETRDNEDGHRHSTSNHRSTTLQGVGDKPTETDALAKFRHFVGIHNDPSLITARVVPNAGIYPRVVQAEKQHHRNYTVFAWLINGALGLQIVFAAALTALGAGNGPRSAVTAFGAMNTIIAGFLTFLKGSGLPNRLKYYENEMLKVREYIEQREREFARGELHEDILREEIALIEEMYENVRRDIEANTPDNYVSMARASNAAGSSSVPPRISRQLTNARSRFDDLRHGFEDRKKDLEQGFHNARSGAEHAYSSNRQDLERGYNEGRTATEQTYLGVRRDMEDQIQTTRRGVEAEVNSTRRGLESEVHGLDRRLEQERHGIEHRIDDEKKAVNSRMAGVESKVQETEEKALAMAEKIAEKVLGMAQKRRDEGHG